MIKKSDLPYIIDVMNAKGYFVYVGANQLNIVGIRNFNKTVNVFNEQIAVFYKIESGWEIKLYNATTKPGLYWMRNFLNPKGTAILKEGQYVNTYAIDYHNNKYHALCQRLNKVAVYRDKNRDERFHTDPNTVEWGYFGINIHRASAVKVLLNVDKNSAGCQVIQNPADFEELMNLARIHKSIYGNKFTYTLITESEVFQMALKDIKPRGIESKNE